MTDAEPSRPVTRRRALWTAGAAMAGLAVGAGGAELADRVVAAPSPESLPNVASPGEELMVEHGVLKRVLLAYRAIGDRLTAGQSVPSGVIVDAAQIVSSYIESFHEGLEEAYVFPRVAGVSKELGTLVTTLLTQHDRGRHLTAAITAAAGDLSSAGSRAGLNRDLAAFVRMYEPHEAWEDTVIYPQLRRSSTPRTLELLGERFADLENTQFGDAALSQILDRVSGVEEQLAIHDLATFTPSGP